MTTIYKPTEFLKKYEKDNLILVNNLLIFKKLNEDTYIFYGEFDSTFKEVRILEPKDYDMYICYVKPKEKIKITKKGYRLKLNMGWNERDINNLVV